MTLTPAATGQLRRLLAQPEPKLIRVGVKNRGCSGLAYNLEYVDKAAAFDETVEQDGVRVLIDSKALFSIIGSEMDWVEDKLSRRFVFRNPNISEWAGREKRAALTPGRGPVRLRRVFYGLICMDTGGRTKARAALTDMATQGTGRGGVKAWPGALSAQYTRPSEHLSPRSKDIRGKVKHLHLFRQRLQRRLDCRVRWVLLHVVGLDPRRWQSARRSRG